MAERLFLSLALMKKRESQIALRRDRVFNMRLKVDSLIWIFILVLGSDSEGQVQAC